PPRAMTSASPTPVTTLSSRVTPRTSSPRTSPPARVRPPAGAAAAAAAAALLPLLLPLSTLLVVFPLVSPSALTLLLPLRPPRAVQVCLLRCPLPRLLSPLLSHLLLPKPRLL